MLAPKLPSFFRSAENQRFDYKPRYFDEEKEKRKEREKRMGGQPGVYTGRVLKFRLKQAGPMRISTIRLVVLVLALTCLAGYIIMY